MKSESLTAADRMGYGVWGMGCAVRGPSCCFPALSISKSPSPPPTRHSITPSGRSLLISGAHRANVLPPMVATQPAGIGSGTPTLPHCHTAAGTLHTTNHMQRPLWPGRGGAGPPRLSPHYCPLPSPFLSHTKNRRLLDLVRSSTCRCTRSTLRYNCVRI